MEYTITADNGTTYGFDFDCLPLGTNMVEVIHYIKPITIAPYIVIGLSHAVWRQLLAGQIQWYNADIGLFPKEVIEFGNRLARLIAFQ